MRCWWKIWRRERRGGEFLAVEPERTRREYPIPSAFGAYADWLFMRTETENTKMRRKK